MQCIMCFATGLPQANATTDTSECDADILINAMEMKSYFNYYANIVN